MKDLATDPTTQSQFGISIRTSFDNMLAIAGNLVALCRKKNQEYGNSWSRRGF